MRTSIFHRLMYTLMQECSCGMKLSWKTFIKFHGFHFNACVFFLFWWSENSKWISIFTNILKSQIIGTNWQNVNIYGILWGGGGGESECSETNDTLYDASNFGRHSYSIRYNLERMFLWISMLCRSKNSLASAQRSMTKSHSLMKCWK